MNEKRALPISLVLNVIVFMVVFRGFFMETGKNCVVFIFEQKGKEISDKSWYNSPELVQNGLDSILLMLVEVGLVKSAAWYRK